MGYYQAGFDVYSVDIDPQPRNPFSFHQGDALGALRALCGLERVKFIERNTDRAGKPVWLDLDDFAAAHASPPCQAHTNAQKIMGNSHPDLIAPTRTLLKKLGLPYVIENVPGAPLEEPFELCGAMFGLGTYRHRLFETSFYVPAPEHPQHVARTTKMGRKPVDGEMMHVVGNFSGVEKAKRAMGIDWMTRDGLRESIPPAYTKYIGDCLMYAINEGKEIAA